MFYDIKIFGHTWRFQGWVGGLNQKRYFDILCYKLGMDVALKVYDINTE